MLYLLISFYSVIYNIFILKIIILFIVLNLWNLLFSLSFSLTHSLSLPLSCKISLLQARVFNACMIARKFFVFQIFSEKRRNPRLLYKRIRFFPTMPSKSLLEFDMFHSFFSNTSLTLAFFLPRTFPHPALLHSH